MSEETPRNIQNNQPRNMEYAAPEPPLGGDAGPYPYDLAQREYDDHWANQNRIPNTNNPLPPAGNRQ